MKKRFFVIGATFLSLLSSCQVHHSATSGTSLACINIIDRNGFSETFSNTDRLKQYANVDFLTPQPYKKVLRVYGRDPNGNIQAYITSYHENGEIRQYLEVVNNRACGLYREWHPSGQLKLEANVINGSADLTMAAEKSWLFDGVNRVWDDAGVLEAEIAYSKGELEGNSLYYHTNGKIWKCVPFVKNEIHGDFKVFLDDGTLLSITAYRNGEKDGQALRFWEEDQMASEEIYRGNFLENGFYYDLEGNLISKVTDGNGFKVLFSRTGISELQQYKNGVQEGRVEIYDNRNKVVGYYHVKNGVKHGEEIEYYDRKISGREELPKISLNWYDGNIQGPVRTWYPNGAQESQKEMSANKKNGLSTAWYENGSLMMIEEYEMNKIVKGLYYQLGEKYPVSTITSGKGVATLYDSEGNFLKKINYVNGLPDL